MRIGSVSIVNLVNRPTERQLEIAADAGQGQQIGKRAEQIEEFVRGKAHANPRRIRHAVNRGINPFASTPRQAVAGDMAGWNWKLSVHLAVVILFRLRPRVVMNL